MFSYLTVCIYVYNNNKKKTSADILLAKTLKYQYGYPLQKSSKGQARAFTMSHQLDYIKLNLAWTTWTGWGARPIVTHLSPMKPYNQT